MIKGGPNIEDCKIEGLLYSCLQTCLLDVLDTAGQEEYSSVRDQYTRQSDGFLIVYAVDERTSFEEAQRIYEWARVMKDDNTLPAVGIDRHSFMFCLS